MAEDITLTSCGPKECHEAPYGAKTMDLVSAMVVASLNCHTIDWPSLDKVTDSADEVRVTTKIESDLTLVESDETNWKTT